MNTNSAAVKKCRQKYEENGMCNKCGKPRETSHKRCDKCRKANTRCSKEWLRRLHEGIINQLGGECFCCGETEMMFLTIDHINNDGAEHIKRFRSDGNRSGVTGKIWQDIQKEGCPPDKYRVACYNCNCGRERNGGICPHEMGQLKLA